MRAQLKIDIVSDVSCPWCIIGYQSLALALAKLQDDLNAHIAWKPFELNPKMGAEGQHLGEHLHAKYGSTDEEIAQAKSMLTARGAAIGFSFNYPKDGRIYNTFNAHRLLYWAREYAKQTELKLALFELYFTQGGNPSNTHDLLGVVAQAGLPIEEARTVLESDRYAKEVREEEQKYLQMGIQSVPTFIINDTYKITGGQPVEEFAAALRKIINEEADGRQ